MNENENNFESLRRLLVLKRHESPPPGYFNNFSSRVLQRIQAGERAESTGLLERFLQVFDVKPVFASGFAGALCLLLLFGIVYADRPDMTSQPLLQTAAITDASLAALSPPALSQPQNQMGIVSSTNPVFSLQPVPVASSFGQQNPLIRPASFSLPGN